MWSDSNIVDADESERVDPRNDQPLYEDESDGVGARRPHEEQHPVLVQFCRSAEHRDRRHERDEQRDCGRKHGQATVARDEFGGRALSTARHRMVDADAERHGQERRHYDVIEPLQRRHRAPVESPMRM